MKNKLTTVSLPFDNRQDAARQLAKALEHYAGKHPLILAIPRGGVAIGRIIADALAGELDLILVRKLGAPGHAEFAIGAVDEQGKVLLFPESIELLHISERYLQEETAHQLALIRSRRARYRPGKKPTSFTDRIVIVVDDGLATGATMTAALKAVKAEHPSRLICAVPVAASESLAAIAAHADEIVCLAKPDPFLAVGRFYRDFSNLSEEEVIQLLDQAAASPPAFILPEDSRLIQLPCGPLFIHGDLTVPKPARGLVLFAHGSGSSRHSPRNRIVASALNALGFATLLMDLLTDEEDHHSVARFDIRLLTERLQAAVQWVLQEPELTRLPIGLFGGSTGAAAALQVAAARPKQVRAVVSRGGRPDMASAEVLLKVQAPTLLIVGSLDTEVLELNRLAKSQMPGLTEINVIPGATHLFEESGALEQVSQHAGAWFNQWL